jgi:myo-inositol-1(or 4)-monophosphatase
VAEHGATNLDILRSHGKNSHTTVSEHSLNCQSFSHRGTQRGIWHSTQKESHHSVVSEEDLRSEEIIIECLDKAMHRHSSISEEQGQIIHNDELTWVIDPVDGSSYYVRGLRSFSVSVALLYQWQPILGIAPCPSNAGLFTTLRAGGSYLNGKPITVSSSQKLRECIFSFSHRFLREPKYSSPREELAPSCRSIRGGSCAHELPYIACGRIDAFVAPAQKIRDFAAGALMVEETGGQFTNFSGRPPDYSSTDGFLHRRVQRAYSQISESLSSCPIA